MTDHLKNKQFFAQWLENKAREEREGSPHACSGSEGSARLIIADALDRYARELRTEAGSLVREPSMYAPFGCFCQKHCMAPIIMGRQTRCRDPEKAALFVRVHQSGVFIPPT